MPAFEYVPSTCRSVSRDLLGRRDAVHCFILVVIRTIIVIYLVLVDGEAP